MDDFSCDKCLKTFINKSNYNRHINRKTPCTYPEFYKKDNKFCCKICNKEYSRKNYVMNHYQKCKTENKTTEDMIDIFRKNGGGKEREEEEESVDRLTFLENKIKKLQEDYDKLRSDQIKINNLTTINSNCNNTNNTNNTNNVTITNNINIVAFGKENMDKFSKKEITRILNKGFNSVPFAVEKIHFNPKLPEYHNVYISNMRSPYIMVHNGNDWELREKNETIEKLYDDKIYLLEEQFTYLEGELPSFAHKKFSSFLDKKDTPGVELATKKNIGLTLYNKRKLINN